jgi:hypothetical protein
LPGDAFNFIVPIQFDSVLVLLFDMILNALTNPFVGPYFLCTFRIVLGNAIVVLDIPFHLMGVFPLFVYNFVHRLFGRSILRVHTLEDEIQQLEVCLHLVVSQPSDLEQV